MRTPIGFACLAVVCCTVVSCGSTSHEPDHSTRGSDCLYLNSFESVEDLEGWTGIFEEMLVSDPAPRGGDKSLDIGGGCIQPAAHIVLPPQPAGATYRLSCWGKLKDESQRGAVVLAVNTGSPERPETALIVEDDEWGYYRSEGTLYCPGGQELRLEIRIGGLVPASMRLDLIKIERTRYYN